MLKDKDFLSRLFIAIPLGLGGLFLCWYSRTTFVLLWCTIASIAMSEYLKMVEKGGAGVNPVVAYLLLLIMLGPPAATTQSFLIFHRTLIVFSVICLGLHIAHATTKKELYNNLFLTFSGALVIGGTMGCLISLHDFAAEFVPERFPAFGMIFLLPFIGAWASDTGAYLTGRQLGKDKLTDLSPGKKVEGVIGALFAGFTASVAFGEFVGLPHGLIFVLALAIPVLSLTGDLLESALKRRCRVSDSGASLGAHGGVLDRFDSIFLTASAVYSIIYFSYVSHVV